MFRFRDLARVVDIVAPFAPRGFSIRGKFVYRSDKPKAVYPLFRTSKLEAWNMIRSSMRRYHTYPPHRAPVVAVCEGSSIRTCRYAQSSDRSSVRRELYAALHSLLYVLWSGCTLFIPVYLICLTVSWVGCDLWLWRFLDIKLGDLKMNHVMRLWHFSSSVN